MAQYHSLPDAPSSQQQNQHWLNLYEIPESVKLQTLTELNGCDVVDIEGHF